MAAYRAAAHFLDLLGFAENRLILFCFRAIVFTDIM
jgi:hypothetical protein